MNELNGWLIVVAFLAGVIFTLLWSLRRVTREVPGHEPTAATAADPAAQEESAQEEPAEEVVAAVSAADDIFIVPVSVFRSSIPGSAVDMSLR